MSPAAGGRKWTMEDFVWQVSAERAASQSRLQTSWETSRTDSYAMMLTEEEDRKVEKPTGGGSSEWARQPEQGNGGISSVTGADRDKTEDGLWGVPTRQAEKSLQAGHVLHPARQHSSWSVAMEASNCDALVTPVTVFLLQKYLFINVFLSWKYNRGVSEGCAVGARAHTHLQYVN